jgi:hypothetical protein
VRLSESSVIIHKLVQAVLKRVLRVSHPLLQLHVLKLIKSQVPFCGRKWRQCMFDDYSSKGLHLSLISKYEGDHVDLPELSTGSAR